MFADVICETRCINVHEDLTGAELEVMEGVSGIEALDYFCLVVVCGGICLIQNKVLPDTPGDKDQIW